MHDELVVLGEHCTRTERRADAAERELIRVKLLSYLEDHIGESFHAIITGVQDFGLFCRLAELPVEGLIHVTCLADDYYYLESGTHTLVGRRSGRRHRLGDRTWSGSPTLTWTAASSTSSWPTRPFPRDDGNAPPRLRLRHCLPDRRPALIADPPPRQVRAVRPARVEMMEACQEKVKRKPKPRKASKKRKQ